MPEDRKSLARETFFEVLGEQRRIRVTPGAAPPASVDREAVLHNDLHLWALRDDTGQYLDVFRERKSLFDGLQNRFLDNHARLTYYKGITDAISMVIEEIESWQADTPKPKGPGPAIQ